MWEGNIDPLPPLWASTGHWTCGLLGHGMTFQPPEPHQSGVFSFLNKAVISLTSTQSLLFFLWFVLLFLFPWCFMSKIPLSLTPFASRFPSQSLLCPAQQLPCPPYTRVNGSCTSLLWATNRIFKWAFQGSARWIFWSMTPLKICNESPYLKSNIQTVVNSMYSVGVLTT